MKVRLEIDFNDINLEGRLALVDQFDANELLRRAASGDLGPKSEGEEEMSLGNDRGPFWVRRSVSLADAAFLRGFGFAIEPHASVELGELHEISR